MFGNKGYRWKLGGTLALIAALGVWSFRQGETVNLSIWRCLAEPRRWDGREIWVPGARITATGDRFYEVQSGSARIRVAGPAPGPVDAAIAMVAVFRAEGPVLEPVRIRPLSRSRVPRRLMEIVSILVLLAVLANFARHFVFRPKTLGVEGAER